MKPLVMISSWPPRLCGIATFAEEAVEFIKGERPERPVYIISHTDGEGENVRPVIDLSSSRWYVPVVKEIKKIDPEVIHIQHEYGLYNYVNSKGIVDNNRGFLKMLDMLKDYPTVVEPHTIHGRMRGAEEEFVRALASKCSVLLFKCNYQKWRLSWTFANKGWNVIRNIMIVPHGARPDRRYAIGDVEDLKRELGLSEFVGNHIVGLVGWIQFNKRWDILTSMWEEIAGIIEKETGNEWDLLAAGSIRDPNDKPHYEKYKKEVELLKQKGLAHYFEFIPRGEIYYKVMAICDFIVLPSLDETQSGTLARIIALNKPFITTAPMEGLTAQTLESGGGRLFTNKAMLREEVIHMACDEEMRMELGNKLKRYLDEVVSWEIVAKQYDEAHNLAIEEKRTGKKVQLALEF
ncbi:MAG: glycosyltransferase [Nitrospinota bacterium]